MTPIRHLTSTLAVKMTDSDGDRQQQMLWKALSTLAGVGAGVATRALVTKAWESRTGEEPPQNPGDPAVAWTQALAWSVGLGVGVGVARTVAARGAAKAWTEATGELPPGFGEASPGRAW